MKQFRKILITLAILSYVELFGLINADDDLRIPGGMKLYDIFTFLIILHLVYLAVYSKVFRNNRLRITPAYIFVSIYLAAVLIVALSMKYRAPVTLVDTFKIARNFFPLILFYYIWYDIVVSGSLRFYQSLLKFLAIGFSLIFMAATIVPDFIRNNFRGLNIKMQTSTGFKMPRTYGYGFIFPYLYFIYQYVRYFLTKKLQLIPFFITFIGVSVQGFRSYFFALIILIFLINILFANRQRIINSLMAFAVVCFVTGITGYFIGGNFFQDKVFSIFTEVSNEEGSYAGRELSDEVFRLPLLMKNFYFGIGFVHGESEYADHLGSVYKDRDYMLYSTDSGMVTMPLMFGVTGTAIIVFFFIRQMWYLYRTAKRSKDTTYQRYSITAFCYIALLLITFKTHAGIINIYGLTPLVTILGMLAGYQSLQKLQTTNYIDIPNGNYVKPAISPGLA